MSPSLPPDAEEDETVRTPYPLPFEGILMVTAPVAAETVI